MAFSDLYSSGFLDRNRDHFASIVRVALSDGEINEEERAFIDRLAHNLEIPDSQKEEILKNPAKYPINPPVLYEARLERLYDIARIVYADHLADDEEMNMMIKLGIGLGFSPGNVEFIVKKAMHLLSLKVDLETFKEEIKHMNR
ncbi:Uncharacterized conserved protein, tellurite resistance protein B (TerB) family [Pustulibacterium marinum]|uniref:Uncharacterized conserved protein, tellurite resistance protein B (TerB) family n=1 Tax=Pustulibacterium marinum TaxID=1224947 RepID=A0A1I7I731_9FLAO|nr:TerB family tellurite resistance protein [Pustulibacterium marinum]SFU68739.1 Uncharacterized conserved protein, tellurite resistance protein B (TerB) family [Pustulibacterium marinum]